MTRNPMMIAAMSSLLALGVVAGSTIAATAKPILLQNGNVPYSNIKGGTGAEHSGGKDTDHIQAGPGSQEAGGAEETGGTENGGGKDTDNVQSGPGSQSEGEHQD